MKTAPSTQSGFSLIEIIIGLSVLILLLVAISNFPAAIRLVTESRQSSLARDIATKQIEDLRSKTYDNLANTDPQTPTPITDTRLTQLGNVSASYQIIDCPATLCKSNPVEATKEVVVTINWKLDGIAKKMQLTTLISRGGLQ